VTITEPAPAQVTSCAEPVPRILACWYKHGSADLASHLSVHGPPFGGRHTRRPVADLAEEVLRSGLTGRGGAGFPAARKWQSVRHGRRSLLVVNAMEGEPASMKDAALIACAPHLVLDGAEMTAMAIGAREVVVCVKETRRDSASSIERAIEERCAARLQRVPVNVVSAPSGYTSSEESSVVSWLGGREAKPQFRAQKAEPLTIRRRPVLVHNAETMAHVALIGRHGAGWYRSVGTEEAPGTALVSVCGAVQRPGVYEIAFGTSVRDALDMGGASLSDLGAVLVGGYGGTWLKAELVDVAYAPGPLKAAGSAMGAGVLAALPEACCGVAETARIAEYMARESAGQCGPCVFGLPRIAADLAALARGEARRSTLVDLRHLFSVVAGRGACRHPDGVVRLVSSALEVFAADFADHARHRPCPHSRRRPLLPVPRAADEAVRRH
jgi:NADH:ubiquinone oxidoreductase subunit F (NADH-binding)